jgi:hypothetical protein
MRRTFTVMTIVFGATAAASDAATTRDRAVSTPAANSGVGALPWGNPLDGKPIHAVMIAPGTGRHDLDRLAYHLELDCVFYALEEVCKEPSIEDQKKVKNSARELEKDLAKSPELIIAAGPRLDKLPEYLQRAIVQAINSGSGLLLANHGTSLGPILAEAIAASTTVENASEMFEGVGGSGTPEWSDGIGFVRVGALGEGRIVELRYPNPAPATDVLTPALQKPLEAEWEYLDVYYSLIAKAARVAAKHEPKVRIQKLVRLGPKAPSESEIPPGLFEDFVERTTDVTKFGPVEAYDVSLTGAAPETYRVRMQLRGVGRSSRRTLVAKTGVRKAASSYAIYFIPPTGRSFLDVWLLDGEKAVDWYTELIDMPGWPRIQSVTLSKRFLIENDSLDIVAALAGDPVQSIPGSFYARATDTFGRVVAESLGSIPADARESRAHLEFVDQISNRVKVEIFVTLGDQSAFSEMMLANASHGHAYLPIYRTVQTAPFTLAARADVTAEYSLRERMKVLRRAGFDSIFTTPGNVAGLYASSCGIDPIPLISLGSRKAEDACVASASRVADEIAHVRESVDLQWHCGQQRVALFAGNELESLAEATVASGPCEGDFLAWLKRNYGDIETLRAVWPVQFGTWEEFSVPSIEEQAKAGNFAPLIDLRAYCGYALEQYAAKSGEAIKRLVPGAHVGSAAIGTTDWLWNESRGVDALCVAFSRSALSGIRHANTGDWPRLVSTRLDEAGAPAAFARWIPWTAAMHGATGICATDALGPGDGRPESGLLNSEGLVNPATQSLAESVAVLRNGYDVLFRDATPFESKIAIYRNTASDVLAPWAPEAYNAEESRNAFVSLFENLGFGCEVITTDDISHGVPDRVSVLVLPGMIAMSDGEIDVIQKFIARGGAVVADRLPAIYSDRGIVRADSVFAATLGFEWHRGSAMVDADFARLSSDHEPVSFRGKLDGTVTRAQDSNPVCNAMDKEKRMALFNFNIADGVPFAISTDAKKPELSMPARQWRGDFLEVLSAFGALRAVILDPQNDPAGEFDFFKLAYGSASILGVARRPNGIEEFERAEVPLDTAMATYDSLLGQDISGRKAYDVKLAPGSATIVAQLPYKVTGIELTSKDEVVFGQRLFYHVSVTAKEGDIGPHLFRVTFSSIDGLPLAHYSKTVVAAGGSADGYIPLALNERAGDYDMTVRDVLTGMQTSKRVRVITNAAAPRVKKNFN